MSKNEIDLKIKLNTTNFQRGMRSVSQSFKGFKDNIIATNQAVDLFSRLTAPLTANVKAAGMQEQAFKSLDITLKNAGRYTLSYRKEIDNLSKSMANISLYGTDNITAGLDVLMRQINITSDHLPQVTKTMVDLASTMGVDVPAAARILGQSGEQLTSSLTKYGIVINPVIASSGDFSEILAEIEKRVKGHAHAMATTGYGGYLRMQNAIKDTTTMFGKFALEIGKSGVYDTLHMLATTAAAELDKIFTPKRAQQAADNVLILTKAGLLGVHSILNILDKIPSGIGELGVIGYLLLGKKGIMLGTVLGAGLDALGLNLGEQVESLVKSSTVSIETIDDKILQATKKLEDRKHYITQQLRNVMSPDEITQVIKSNYILSDKRAEELSISNIEGGESLQVIFDLKDNEKNVIRRLEKDLATLLVLKDKFLNGEQIDLNKSSFGTAKDAVGEIINSLDSVKTKIVSTDIKPDATSNNKGTYTSLQYKLVNDLVNKTIQAKNEIELLKYPEGFIRDSKAINLQAEEYINKFKLARDNVNEWETTQIKLLQEKRLDSLKAEIAKMQGEKVYHENIRVKGEYVAGIDGINAQADELLLNSGDNSALKNIAESWREIALAEHEAKEALNYYKFDFQEATDLMHEGMQALSQPLATALFKGTTDGLASALAENLKMFAAQKAAHLLMESAYETTIGIATMLNPMREWESGFHFAAAKEFALGAALMGTFVMASNLRGMAHSGIDYIPREGTWLLDKGERVIDSRTNKDLKEFIAKGANNVTVNVTINDGDKDSVLEALPVLQKVIVDTVSNNIMSGGQIKRVIREYN